MPATRPDQVAKAVALDVDVVIVDLEDAVGPGEKNKARGILSGLAPGRKIHVRINSLDTRYWELDVKSCCNLDFVDALILPKVKSSDEFGRVRSELASTLPIVALIETPQGIQAVDQIAKSGFERLMFGSADYCAAIGATPSNELFSYPRSRMVVASAAAGLPAPVDGPTTNFRDLELIREDLVAARALGMGGKLCIHPDQLPAVREVFAARENDRAWAQEVIAAAECHAGEVFSLRGQMIDEPIIERARRVLRS